MIIDDRMAFERRVLSQAAFLSSGCIADLLGARRARRPPTPAEELIPAKTGR